MPGSSLKRIGQPLSPLRLRLLPHGEEIREELIEAVHERILGSASFSRFRCRTGFPTQRNSHEFTNKSIERCFETGR